jgi:hypothetical protein
MKTDPDDSDAAEGTIFSLIVIMFHLIRNLIFSSITQKTYTEEGPAKITGSQGGLAT